MWVLFANIFQIRNSWGPEWGLNGYILLERGVNMCAIAKRAAYPIAN